jgi:hypothetical protein
VSDWGTREAITREQKVGAVGSSGEEDYMTEPDDDDDDRQPDSVDRSAEDDSRTGKEQAAVNRENERPV